LVGLIPVSGSQKAYVFVYEDVSIMAPPELASSNYGDDTYLVSGYIYREVKQCSGGPCLINLEKDPAFILLKFKPSSALVWEPSRVELHLSALWLDYYLPSSDFYSLCRFSISLVDVDFSEDDVTWKEVKEGVPWNPEDHLKPLGTFFVTPQNSSHLVIDLTDQLKGMIGPGSEIRLAIAPSPEWWKYGWEEGMGCSLYIRSSEGKSPPYLLLMKETQDQEQEQEQKKSAFPIYKIPVPQLPKIEIPESMDPGEDGEKIPLPDIPVQKIPKLQPKVIPPPNVPENPEPGNPPQPQQEYPPTFSLHMDPPILSVYPGGDAVFTVQVVPFFGFSQPVKLKVIGGPQDSLIQVIPNTINPAAAPKPEAKLVIEVNKEAPPGNYIIQVEGSGGGLKNTASAWLQVKPIKKPQQTSTQTQAQSTSLTSTETAASSESDFQLELDSDLYETSPGRAVTMWVKLIPVGGFNQPVDLSVTGVPPGSLFLIHNSPLTPDQKAALRILPGEETPPGSYEVIVMGSYGNLIRFDKATLRVKGSEKSISTGTGGEGVRDVGKSESEIRVRDTSLVSRVGVPVKTIVTAISAPKGSIGLEVLAPREVIVRFDKTILKRGESTYVYLTPRAPGDYEVKIMTRDGGSEVTIRLRVAPTTPITRTAAGAGELSTSTTQKVGYLSMPVVTMLILLLTLLILALIILRIRATRRRNISGEG